jgi:hypothetical protein
MCSNHIVTVGLDGFYLNQPGAAQAPGCHAAGHCDHVLGLLAALGLSPHFPLTSVWCAGLATNPFINTFNTDWVTTSSYASIDFASFNIYPDLWRANNGNDVTFINSWITQHSSDAKTPLAKPAIIKETGMQVLHCVGRVLP